jgi:hypothetical protein
MSNGTKINQTALSFMLLAVIGFFLGCTKKPQPEGYRVISYEAATHQWTILRTGSFDGLTRRLTVVCSSYKSADHESVTGPEACRLQVGPMMIPNSSFPPAGKSRESLEIQEMTLEKLSITEGAGADRVMQEFNILKYELLPDNSPRYSTAARYDN